MHAGEAVKPRCSISTTTFRTVSRVECRDILIAVETPGNATRHHRNRRPHRRCVGDADGGEQHEQKLDLRRCPTGGTTSGQGGAASSGTLEQALNARGEYDSIASQMESGPVEQYNDYFALTDV